MKCAVPDCNRYPNGARGWCTLHYRRWRRYGNTDGRVLPGMSSEDVCDKAGVTYRQLDHWSAQGYVRPSLSEHRAGQGVPHRWSETDAEEVAVVAELLRLGMDLRVVGGWHPEKRLRACKALRFVA